MAGQNFKVGRDGFLLQYLFETLQGQSKTSIRNMLSKGQVQVNGESTTAFDRPVRKGDTITILPKGISIARATTEDARDEVVKAGVRIVFEDDYYIVVDKPSGLLTVSTARGSSSKTGHKEKTLYAILNAYDKVSARMRRKEDILSGREPDRSTAKIWIVHRLDKGTSGLVIFAKDERSKDILQSKWKEQVIERTYTAWLEGRLTKKQGAVQSWLTENEKSLKVYSSPVETKDGQLAITHFKVTGYGHRGPQEYTKADFSLSTGRKNQIRVHAADLGHPIAGDDKYGAETNPLHRLALHAGTLVFRHPYTGKTIRCKSELPEVFERIEKID